MDAISITAIVGITIFLVVFTFSLNSYRQRLRARRVALLSDSLSRMKTVIAELMERVNEADQHVAFIAEIDRNAASSKLKVAASDLVTLTDCLSTIEQLIIEKRLNDAASLLSASTRVIEKIMRVLSQLEPILNLPPASDNVKKIGTGKADARVVRLENKDKLK